jgi:aspartyl-tRNA(Asn)/glutamyl-tRNA(Gln) amidotransferase subunit A
VIDRFNAFVALAPDAKVGEGALAGLRVGIKANIAVAGLPWTGGMKLFEQRTADADGEVVARLRAAGAAIAGILNMHEAALGATTDNLWFGTTINPHSAGFTAGGSSGGSGAAVAAGLVDAALGTDTLGSIRIPASYCGVYGLKPTLGAVPTNGLMFLDHRYDCIGPLARDLDTVERVWRVIGPGESGDPPLTRLLTWRDLGGIEVQPAVRAAYDKALAQLALPEQRIDLPDPTAIRLAALAGIARSLIADLGPLRTGRRHEISPELHFLMDALEAMPEQPQLLAWIKSAMTEALADDGVMLLPATPQVAFAHGTTPPHSQADFTALASIAGLPALSLPAGTDQDGLPIGLQLVGPPGSEVSLINIARELQPALGGSIAPPEEGS